VTSPTQLQFDLQGMTFAAQAWGQASKPPILALHGWFDNSASFFRLAPLLAKEFYVVALDMAGHGLSDHRPGVEPYNIWADIGEVFGIADALGWGQFSLMGHSRGAVIAMLSAGTFPQRIRKLALLDGMYPEPVDPQKAPEQLARSIQDTRRERRLRTYDSLEPMIEVRMEGFWSLSRLAAETLVERGVKAVDGGYCWSSDPHLKAASAIKLTREHIAAFMDRITAETKLILASEGMVKAFEQRTSGLSAPQPVVVTGSHHFHMEADSCAELAEILNQFYAG
jgi:pimeloyl-ACP methyl ester carboxylesterase